MKILSAFFGNFFQLVGSTGTTTMCSGWFHEVEVPKELKSED